MTKPVFSISDTNRTVPKTKVLISCAVITQLTYVFVFAYAKRHVFLMKWFISSRDVEGKKNQKEATIRSTIFDRLVIQGSKDLIRLIKKFRLGSNTSQPLYKAPFGYSGFTLHFHNSVFMTQ